MITKKFMMSFLPYDYEGIEKMLMEKSSEGWQLVKAGEIFWTFQQGERDKFQYNVTYIPDASEYRSDDTEHQLTLDEYCANAGWERVCNYKKIQIYRNQDALAIPIDTDEEQKLRMIHLAVKKWLLIPTWIIILLFLILFVISIFTFLKRNDSLTPELVKLFLFPIIIVAAKGVEIINYYIWFNRSKKSILNTGKCYSAKHADIIQNVSMILTCILIIWCTAFPIADFVQDISEFVFYIILIIFYQIHASWIKKLCKYTGWPKLINRIFIFFLALALSFFCSIWIWGMLMVRGILPEI